MFSKFDVHKNETLSLEEVKIGMHELMDGEEKINDIDECI
jgi:hypothetical protein